MTFYSSYSIVAEDSVLKGKLRYGDWYVVTDVLKVCSALETWVSTSQST